MTGHYHPDLDEEAAKCWACGIETTHRAPKTAYRWCCNCGSMHIDRPGRVVSGTTLPAGATLLFQAAKVMDEAH